MPVNDWKNQLFATDVVQAMNCGEEDFGPLLAELISRIRDADWYNPGDIVLRNLVNDMESAGDVTQLAPDLDLFMLWGNEDQRLWVETSFPLEEFNDRQRQLGHPTFTPPDRFDAVIARAKATSGMSPAEFDYSLSARDGRAQGAIADACYVIANRDRHTVNTNTSSREMQRRSQRGRHLLAGLEPRIRQLITEANGKSYTGWSTASAGPIRYAEPDAPERGSDA